MFSRPTNLPETQLTVSALKTTKHNSKAKKQLN